MNRSILHWGKPIISYLVSLIYPPLCAVCTRRLHTTELGVCVVCALKLAPYRPNRWYAEERLLGSRIFRHLYSLYIYEKDTPIQEAIHNYKYHSYSSFAKMLARRSVLLYPLGTNDYDLVIVVPTSYDHIIERGYNQSLVFARFVAGLIGKTATDEYILRYNRTSTQTSLNKFQRKGNAQKLFYINPQRRGILKGARVLVVDDVLTTGATLLAVLDLLEEEGILYADVLTATVAV